MKPKNKYQERVLALSKKLFPITDAQAKWAYQNCIEHIGRRTKKGVISCLECGYSWENKTTETHCTCPNCDARLTINDTKQRVFDDYQYLCIITACEEFQVLRFVYVDYKAKAGEKATYYHSEVVQRWIAPDVKCTTLARLRPMGYFVHSWSFRTPLEIRPEKALYNVTPTCVYPRQKLTPEIKRSGYKRNFHDLTPSDFFYFILSDSKAETLLKAGQVKLFRYFTLNSSRNINDYWASIRICIRNGFKMEDASIWCDYIDLLRFFGKDLHNAKYVCPQDLKKEHDRYVQKKREYLERERSEEAKLKALESEAEFIEMKTKFFGIRFSDELIQVRVLESVEEIISEGDVMHHCVFTNDYHLKPDSLILSASCIGGERLETVEVSLAKLQVIQSRGVCNKNTKHHDRIVSLVNQHIPLIEQRLAV